MMSNSNFITGHHHHHQYFNPSNGHLQPPPPQHQPNKLLQPPPAPHHQQQFMNPNQPNNTQAAWYQMHQPYQPINSSPTPSSSSSSSSSSNSTEASPNLAKNLYSTTTFLHMGAGYPGHHQPHQHPGFVMGHHQPPSAHQPFDIFAAAASQKQAAASSFKSPYSYDFININNFK